MKATARKYPDKKNTEDRAAAKRNAAKKNAAKKTAANKTAANGSTANRSTTKNDVPRKKKFGLELVVFLGLFLYFTYIIFNQQGILDARQQEMEDINNKIEAENILNKELLEEEENINSDEYIERIAREKFGLVKGGEKVFVDINK